MSSVQSTVQVYSERELAGCVTCNQYAQVTVGQDDVISCGLCYHWVTDTCRCSQVRQAGRGFSIHGSLHRPPEQAGGLQVAKTLCCQCQVPVLVAPQARVDAAEGLASLYIRFAATFFHLIMMQCHAHPSMRFQLVLTYKSQNVTRFSDFQLYGLLRAPCCCFHCSVAAVAYHFLIEALLGCSQITPSE